MFNGKVCHYKAMPSCQGITPLGYAIGPDLRLLQRMMVAPHNSIYVHWVRGLVPSDDFTISCHIFRVSWNFNGVIEVDPFDPIL